MNKIKLILCFIFISLSTFLLPVHAADDIKLYFDDSLIKTDVSPIIINDRTMVPVRSIFEKMNAEVTWINSKKQVIIKSLSKRIVLNVDKTRAYVDDKAIELDTAPVIVNDRTLIPVRFVSENLGYDVEWDNKERAVHINSPYKEPEELVIKRINATKSSRNSKVTIFIDNIEKPSISYASNPQRFIADFENTVISGGDSKKTLNSDDITEVRYAEHDGYLRVVIESPADAEYTVSYSSNSMTIIVECEHSEDDTHDDKPESDNTDKDDNDTSSSDAEDEPETAPDVIVKVDRPLVVIDAGHGGWDSGAVGYDDDGEVVVRECDANLAIALRVQHYLVKNNVDVIMTRQTNKALGTTEMEDLLSRCKIANDADATLFVSIHNNSFTEPTATGTEILYADTDSKINYGVTSKTMAQNIITPLVKATGLQNRGLHDSPKMVVLGRTEMPSVLIECAFVSNPSDREILTDDSEIDDMGYAIAEGIIKTINQLP